MPISAYEDFTLQIETFSDGYLEMFDILPGEDIYDWGVKQERNLFNSMSLFNLKMQIECVPEIDYSNSGGSCGGLGCGISIPCWFYPTIIAVVLAILNIVVCTLTCKLK
jgi:hypothetical protein